MVFAYSLPSALISRFFFFFFFTSAPLFRSSTFFLSSFPSPLHYSSLLHSFPRYISGSRHIHTSGKPWQQPQVNSISTQVRAGVPRSLSSERAWLVSPSVCSCTKPASPLRFTNELLSSNPWVGFHIDTSPFPLIVHEFGHPCSSHFSSYF